MRSPAHVEALAGDEATALGCEFIRMRRASCLDMSRPATPSTRHWELQLALGGLLLGLVDHPLAQVDEGILLPCGHGIGQLAQLDREPVQILAQGRNSHETTSPSSGVKMDAAISEARPASRKRC
jgi:hypothetical protein